MLPQSIASNDNNQELLIAILSEIKELRTELNDLLKRVSSENWNDSGTDNVTLDAWWEEKLEVSNQEDTPERLLSQTPRKQEFASEEEYQQGIIEFQARLDTINLQPKEQLEQELTEQLDQTRRIIEEDLGRQLD